MFFVKRSLGPLSLALTLACASAEPADERDSGIGRDAGSGRDAGGGRDGGVDVDGGDDPMDASVPRDAGDEPLSGCPIAYPLVEDARNPALAVDSDRVFVAWADEVNDVHVAYTDDTPLEAAAWTQGVALPGGGSAGPAILAAAGRLYLVGLVSGDWTYAISDDLSPTSAADWTTYTLSTPDVAGATRADLLLYEGRPALLLQRASSEAELWLADAATPMNAMAWTHIPFVATNRARLAVLEDRLVVVDTPGNRMPAVRVRIANSATPSAEGDFATIELDDAARPGAVSSVAVTSDGRLAVAWEDFLSGGRESQLAIANPGVPTAADDFTRTVLPHALGRPTLATAADGFGLAYEDEDRLGLSTTTDVAPGTLDERLELCGVTLAEAPALATTAFGFALAALEVVPQQAGPTQTNLVIVVGGWTGRR